MKLKTAFLLIFSLLLSNCSVVQNAMMKRMAKMPQEDKMKMMSRMMGDAESTTCADMMERMACMMGDSVRKSDMAKEMIPLCAARMMEELNNVEKTDFLIGITGGIILAGYDSLTNRNTKLFTQIYQHQVCLKILMVLKT